MSTLKIVIASTRPGRLGEPIGDWLLEAARRRARFDTVEVLDLAAIDLPLFDEPHHPKTGRYQHAHTLAWSDQVNEADALIFVSPEYNGFPPATLINAVDYLHAEWVGKPLGILTYGAGSGGARARGLLELLATNLTMVPAQTSFGMPQVFGQVAGGMFTPTDSNAKAAAGLVDELAVLVADSADARTAA